MALGDRHRHCIAAYTTPMTDRKQTQIDFGAEEEKQPEVDGAGGQSEAQPTENEASDEENRGRGRPPKDPEERRTESHGLYLSRREKKELKARAEAAGMSVNQYLRASALEESEIEAASAQDLRRELRWIGTTLNRLCQEAGQGEVDTAKIEETIETLQETLSHLE